MTLQKINSHIQSLVIYFFFPTSPIKLKSGMQIRGERLPIANHLDQSLWLPDQKPKATAAVSSRSRSQTDHICLFGLLLWQAFGFAVLLPTSGNCAKMRGQNHFAESTGMFWLFFIQFWFAVSQIQSLGVNFFSINLCESENGFFLVLLPLIFSAKNFENIYSICN